MPQNDYCKKHDCFFKTKLNLFQMRSYLKHIDLFSSSVFYDFTQWHTHICHLLNESYFWVLIKIHLHKRSSSHILCSPHHCYRSDAIGTQMSEWFPNNISESHYAKLTSGCWMLESENGITYCLTNLTNYLIIWGNSTAGTVFPNSLFYFY